MTIKSTEFTQDFQGQTVLNKVIKNLQVIYWINCLYIVKVSKIVSKDKLDYTPVNVTIVCL